MGPLRSLYNSALLLKHAMKKMREKTFNLVNKWEQKGPLLSYNQNQRWNASGMDWSWKAVILLLHVLNLNLTLVKTRPR